MSVPSRTASKIFLIGLIGAGLVKPPMEAFKKTLHGFAKKYEI
jgi:hypothetical protein